MEETATYMVIISILTSLVGRFTPCRGAKKGPGHPNEGCPGPRVEMSIKSCAMQFTSLFSSPQHLTFFVDYLAVEPGRIGRLLDAGDDTRGGGLDAA